MFTRKNIIRIAVNTLVGVVLILIWSRFINLNEVVKAVKGVKPQFLILCLLFYLLSGAIRSFRLKIFLKKYNFPWKDLLFLNFLSQFLSFTIPIRAGEIAKGVYLSTRSSAHRSENSQMPFAQGLLFSFLDRFIDFWVIVLMLTILFLLIPVGIASQVRVGLVIILIGFSGATIMILATQRLAKRLIPFKFAHAIIDGFDVFRRDPLELLFLLFLSILAAISDAAILYFVLLSLRVDLSFIRVFMSNMLFALTFLIPAAPGYVGNVEAGAVAILSGVMGIQTNLASAAAVVFHILNLIMVPVLGIVSLYSLKFDLGQVWSKLRKN